ncbi:MAG: TolC family protein [Myxococcales bacterium]|nr:MAG: TolC family protein [Myxococcales bacterium]
MMGKGIRLVLLLLVLCTTLFSLAAQAKLTGLPSNVGLAYMIRAAERNYPGLLAARKKIVAAEAQLSEAKVSPFFQFQVIGAFGLAPESRGTPIFSPNSELPLGSSWAPIAKLGVEGAIPLWTFGKIGAAQDAARAGIKAAKEEKRQMLSTLRFDVRRAYFALQLSLDVMQMISEGEGKLDAAIKSVEERLEQDDPDIKESDRWRLSSTLAEVQARSAEANQLENTSRAALRTLTGLKEVHELDCPSEPADFQEKPLDWYQRAAHIHRPEVQMLGAALAARRAQSDLATAGYFPDLGLAVSALYGYAPGIDDQDNAFVIDRANTRSLTAGLVAKWSLDLWGNSYRAKRSNALFEQTLAQKDEALRGIELEVSSVYYELENARKSESSWEKGHSATRAWFISAAQGYQVGTAEARDLVDAIKAYFTARFSHTESIRSFNTAASKLERVIGTELIPLDRWEKACE